MSKEKAAVFILLGQSNAVGHGIPMDDADIISRPLKNVYGLNRKCNQSFDIKKLTFTNFTSAGMNLAEEQDNTYSLSNCMGILWQREIDNNKSLPNLYIIQIAIGAQGVTDEFMWYPARTKKLISGKLGNVDISLYPFSIHIFSLLDEYFKSKNTEYEIIGLHWRGGEEDTTIESDKLHSSLSEIYNVMLDGFNTVLKNPPVFLHKICCPDRVMDLDPTGENLKKMEYINSVFEEKAIKYPNVSVFDVTKAPHFINGVRGNGIFISDAVHYTKETNFWVAKYFLDYYLKTFKKQ